ncbi:MAG: UbiA family prenyltransferase [Anaerolineales bacterium]|nr:UbiA family prenyltransferase [Anaerolineales bacterium]
MKRFFALSRTSHGILDLAVPAFCALLWLGNFPQLPVILLSLFTAFAGYTAVYALNDLVGVKVDKEKFAGSGINPGYSVETSEQRYPLAQNLISFKGGLFWMGTWFILALAGSYLLNPVIVFILLAAAVLEIIYCLLLKVTYLRTLVSGVVKTSGPIAAVFVVDPNPSPYFLLLLFIWLFLWEIGGQNIPADWNDTVEDKRVNAKTIPISFGVEKAGLIVITAMALTVIASGFLPLISPANLGLPYILVSLIIGYVFLIQPGFQLYKYKEGRQAANLFDKASYYPVAQLVLITIFLIASKFIG